MIDSSLAADIVVTLSADAAAASTQPAVQRSAGVPCEQVGQDRLHPAEHLAEAERHRRREEQADRPEQQQRQAAGAAADEPAIAHRLPALDAAARVEQERRCRRRARRRAR